MKIKAILVKTNSKPEIIEFNHSLKTMQELVGGNIEMIQLYDDDVDIVINEEGKLLKLGLNKFIVHNGNIIDALVGDILIVGVNNKNGSTISIPKEKIPFYMELFNRDVIDI